MEYELDQLREWTRRAGGDVVTRLNETITSDGSQRITINNDGDIRLVSIEVDMVIVTGGKISGNVVTLAQAPVQSAEVFVTYTRSRYSDAEILNYVMDGSRYVQADLHTRWVLDTDMFTLTDDNWELFEQATGRVDPRIDKLMVLRSAIAIYTAKVNQAADDAIKIKDGDTSIDTSATSQSSETRLKNLWAEYTRDLNTVRANRFQGIADSTPVGYGEYLQRIGGRQWR